MENSGWTRWWFQIFFSVSPRTLGKWSNFTNIFQMGWNHFFVFFLPKVDRKCLASHKKSFDPLIPFQKNQKNSSFQIENQWFSLFSSKFPKTPSNFFSQIIHVGSYILDVPSFSISTNIYPPLGPRGTVWTASHSISYQPYYCPGAFQKEIGWSQDCEFRSLVRTEGS